MEIALSIYGSTRAWLITPRMAPAIAPERRVVNTKIIVFNYYLADVEDTLINTWMVYPTMLTTVR
jgi:hypothetical protein